MAGLLSATYTYSGIAPVQASAAATHVDDVEVGDSTTYDYIRHTLNVNTGVCHRIEFDAGIEVIADLGAVYVLDHARWVHDWGGGTSFPGLQTCLALGADGTWLVEDIYRTPMEFGWSEDGVSWTNKIGGVAGTVPAEADFQIYTDLDPTPGGPGDNAQRTIYTFAAPTNARYVRIRWRKQARSYDDQLVGYADAKVYDFRIYGDPIEECDPPADAPVLSGTLACCGATHNLSWTAVEDAESYTLSRDGVAYASGITDLTYSATGQDGNAAIVWTVAAVNSCGTGVPSDPVMLGPFWARGEACSTSLSRSDSCSTNFSRSAPGSTSWSRGGECGSARFWVE